jgi:F-box and leucine-rich repeat protein 10/11
MERRQSRPATSHVTSFESMKDDAELLLNFAQPHNFPPIAKLTPPQRPQIEQESPPFKRLSASTTASEQLEEAARNCCQEDGQDSQLSHEEPCLSKQAQVKSIQSRDAHGGRFRDTKQETKVARKGAERLRDDSSGRQQESELFAALKDRLAASPADMTSAEEKKRRRIQPTTQAPCAKCNSLQATVGSEDQDGLTSWIGCNGCQRWFHIVCAGFKDIREVRTVDKYICSDCEPVNGHTTFVRKSSRARTAIDYAGLNQGMIKSSEETTEHHWLQPIKDGRIKFQPDDFARIRPELLTTEYLEKTDGMKRPIVIPSCWNAQFGRKKVADPSAEEDEDEDMVESEVVIDSEGNEFSSTISNSGPGNQEEVLECGQDLLEMVMPENLTVRRVAELHGLDMPLDVIDVKSQQTAQKWNLKKWADYYESTGEKTVRNVISLEVSQSKLGKLLQRPKIVRDLDLQDAVWPLDLPSKAVQFYCLMSVADCYTDFHIDFGGSSVYYHILKGKKTFFFIPPEEKHLKKYEQWNNSPLQNQTFLGDVTGECSRVDLSQGDTMLIPSGWIHAVWTPENSLVIGGNFLTRMSYDMQIKVNRIEIDTKTALKFRYPLFQKVNWYAAIRYLEDDPVPEEVSNDFEDDPDYVFLRANPVWHEFGHLENDAEPGDSFYNARFYSRMEIDGLPALRDYLYRTALIASDFHVDGVTETTRTNVKKSIPKGHGEPMDLIRTFGIWVAWKTGCVAAPDWVRPDSPSLSSLARKAEKQKSEAVRTPGERVSSRVQSQLEHARAEVVNTPVKLQNGAVDPEASREETKRPKRTPKTSGLGPQRFACDPCRKRRIRCRHREGDVSAPKTENERPRAHPSISVEIPQPMPAQSFASFDGPHSPLQAMQPEQSANSILTSTSLPSQEVDGFNSQPTPSQVELQDPMVVMSSSSKKGRSKACDECRKSKVRDVGLLAQSVTKNIQRRCIHDENGKVDPFKAAEPSKPRGSTSSKRQPRLSDEIHASAKNSEAEVAEDDTGLVGQAHSALAEAVSDTAALEEDDFNALIDPSLRPAIQQLQAATHAMTQSAHEMKEAAVPDPEIDNPRIEDPAETPVQAKLTIHIDPQLSNSSSTGIRAESHPHHHHHPAALATSSSQISANSLVSPPDSHHNEDFSPSDHNPDPDLKHDSVGTNAEGGSGGGSSSDSTTSSLSNNNALQTPKSTASRHSSRQPKPVERYVPDAGVRSGNGREGTKEGDESKQPSSTASGQMIKEEARRASSSGDSVATSSNVNTEGGGGKARRRMSSHTSPCAPPSASARAGQNVTSSQSPSQARVKHGPPGDATATESEAQLKADEESLKLIRVLQEEEFGLRRRRGSMRA